MRTNTLTPLAQFGSWLGLDLWKLAGITKNPVININSSSCDCYFKNAYDSGNSWSRNELEEILIDVEDFFLKESGAYVAPFFISDEKHRFTNKEVYEQTVEPHYPCGDIIYGTKELISNGEITATRDDGLGNILDIFTITFTMPNRFNKEDIRVYFTEDDLPRDCDELEFNDHRFEIRPFSKVFINDIDDYYKQVILEIPAYLFVKPELEDSSECQPHSLDTYVSEVEIILEDLNYCEQGYFIIPNYNCGTLPCGDVNYSACIKEKTVYKNKWATLKPQNCTRTIDENDVVTYTYSSICCLEYIPREVAIHYVTGHEYNCYREIQNNLMDILGKIGINLIDCMKETCDCNHCTNRKIEYYLKVQSTTQEYDREDDDLKYAILVDKIGLNYADGLKPTIGIIQGMRQLSKVKCSNKNLGGKYL